MSLNYGTKKTTTHGRTKHVVALQVLTWYPMNDDGQSIQKPVARTFPDGPALDPVTGIVAPATPEGSRSSFFGRFKSFRDNFRVSVRCPCPSSSTDVVVDPEEPWLATVGVEMLSSVAIGVDVEGVYC
jgi:hypothetical protein